MIDATKQPAEQLCQACFTGEYPVPLPDESQLGKHLLEATLTSPTAGQGAARAEQPVRNDPVTETPEPQNGAANAYAAAGVDIEAADRAIDLMKGWVEKARRPEMIGGLGGFAGLFDASALTKYKRPLLATSTDGVGTKVAIAQAMDVHDTIGFDLVGMVVDDLVVCGAEPLFMTDYIATGRVVPERIAAIVKGIAEACVEAGCALVGGETAEHPGLLGPRRVRRGRRDHRCRRGRRPARPRPGPPRRRGDRDGRQRPALQRLLPGAPRAARAGRLGPGPRGRGARRHARRRAAGPDPDLRQGLPRARPPHPHPRDVPRDRWRPRGQPGAGDARRAHRDAGPLLLDPAADLRRRTPRGRRSPRPTWR